MQSQTELSRANFKVSHLAMSEDEFNEAWSNGYEVMVDSFYGKVTSVDLSKVGEDED